MNKLIKLSDTHYIVVDDSIDFTEKDWYYDNMQKSIRIGSNNHITGGYKQKIIHSTQPLEPSIYSTRHDNKDYVFIKPLSLSEIEEAIHGYSVEKIIPTKYCIPHKHYISKDDKICYDTGFKDGFKAHQELVKDKLFTIDDMMDAMGFAAAMDNKRPIQHLKEEAEEYIKTKKLPKTEWNIEFDEQGKIRLL